MQIYNRLKIVLDTCKFAQLRHCLAIVFPEELGNYFEWEKKKTPNHPRIGHRLVHNKFDNKWTVASDATASHNIVGRTVPVQIKIKSSVKTRSTYVAYHSGDP